MSETTPVRAVIYVRQSKDAEGNGHAVARQQEACERLAAQRGWTVAAVLADNDTSASSGRPRPGYAALMRMVEARQADVVIVWAIDRLVRKLADLEHVIDACETAGVRLATVSGDLDLSTDQGRLVGRILASVARGEVERKGTRQRAANQQAARNGQRRKGTPRPFGFAADHVTHEPGEAAAIRWAADALLGGATVSAVMREWNRRGLVTPQSGKPFTRNSVTTIMRNPALAGILTYDGEEVSSGGAWAILGEAPWRAVDALLGDQARKPPRGVRTLLGGLAACRCGNVMEGSTHSVAGKVYRCRGATRGGRPGPHAQQQQAAVDGYVTEVIVARLARPDLADLVTPRRPDLGPLHREAAAIRRNLDELAADRALGLVTRSQMIAATERGQARLAQIAAGLAAAAETSALAPFAAASSARQVWDGLDGARKRAVIAALCQVVIHPAGRGARKFDPDSVQVIPRSTVAPMVDIVET